jgi:hypothetical protein
MLRRVNNPQVPDNLQLQNVIPIGQHLGTKAIRFIIAVFDSEELL